MSCAHSACSAHAMTKRAGRPLMSSKRPSFVARRIRATRKLPSRTVHTATSTAGSTRAQDHDGAQAFGYDLWRSRQIAELLFPLPSQQLDRERFIHARVMLTIATLMALTDGSLPLLLRLPA